MGKTDFKDNSKIVADSIIKSIDVLTANLANTDIAYLSISDYHRIMDRLRLFYATDFKDFSLD